MTDKPPSLSTQVGVPSQNVFPAPPSASPVKDEAPQKVELVEEEPYTIKCICNFFDDDGNTIYCETCDTWQHIDCFYPLNRDEAIREDFAHSCADCKPRPLDRQKAIERTLRLKNAVVEDTADKKTAKRPPSKSHKKKPKLSDITVLGPNGVLDSGKHGALTEQASAAKKSKSSHRPSQSVSSQPSKRSPSYGNSRTNHSQPLSPATTPPDLPDDFQIHHYSAGFCSLYNEQDVPNTHNNAFASIAIPTALARWLREPDSMQQEVGHAHSDVFQDTQQPSSDKTPKLEVTDATRSVEPGTTLRWRSLKSTTPIEKDIPLIELHGEIGFQKDYCANPDNLWADLSSPLPFVFFHPILPLYIDTRKEGSLARYVRRSCKPNAQLDTFLSGGSEYHFWLVSDRYVPANVQITLPWDFRLEKTVCPRWLHLLGLSDDDGRAPDESEMDDSEYNAISNWIDRILSEYGGCACELENNCAFARFHRHYLYGKNHGRSSQSKKKHRKHKTQTISPSSTGHATNSRAASEGHGDDGLNNDGRYESVSSRSKPPSRERSPVRHGSFDQLGILTEPTDRDKRKVAMVEDSFRRMEQHPAPKKKKRLSDGATPTASKTETQNGSTQAHGHYVDSGTSRSKSGSPASVQSPTLANNVRSPSAGQDSVARSRQSSLGPRAEYCNASVQTDPVDGEWFSEPAQSPRPKKKVIPLSRRLLNSRHRCRVDNERKGPPLPGLQSDVTAMELDTPPQETKSTALPLELQPAKTEVTDIAMSDVPVTQFTASWTPSLEENAGKNKSPDLRVQLPPVPTFDDSFTVPNIQTPLSASSALAQSPLAVSNLPSPFGPPAVNGVAMHPSPVKKKLSLSDYTKSRMNKVGGKVAGGATMLKPSLSNPDEMNVDISMDAPPIGKHEEETPAGETVATKDAS